MDGDCPDCHVRPRIVPGGSGGRDPVLDTIVGSTGHRFGVAAFISFSFDVIDHCAADINDDGTVSVTDLVEVMVDWNSSGVPADTDRDGVVDVTDLVNVILSWGDCVEPEDACSFAPPCGG